MKNKLIKQKKGSHVGMILSFVVFITFLVYLISILQPSLKTDNSKEEFLQIVQETIIAELQEKVLVVNYEINLTEDYECLKIPLHTNYEEWNFTVTDKNDNIKRYKRINGNNTLLNWSLDEDYFKIRYINYTLENPTTPLNCTNQTSDSYKIKKINSEEYIFEPYILELLEKYETDYEALKKELEISTSDNFAISFEYENRTIISTNSTLPEKNIYSERIPLRYIDKETHIKFGFLGIKVW